MFQWIQNVSHIHTYTFVSAKLIVQVERASHESSMWVFLGPAYILCCIVFVGLGPHSVDRQRARWTSAQEGSQQCAFRLERDRDDSGRVMLEQGKLSPPSKIENTDTSREQRLENPNLPPTMWHLKYFFCSFLGCLLLSTYNSSLINRFEAVACSQTLGHCRHSRKPAS